MKNRDAVLEFIDSSGLTLVTLIMFSILIVTPECPWYIGLLGITVMYIWIYFAHRFSHIWPTEGPIRYINWHWIFHHVEPKLVDRNIELCIETFNDLFLSLSIIALQYITGVWIVPIWITIFYAIVWTSTHIINYSIVGSETHRNHHRHVYTNFGPDTMDHLFGTNYDDTMEDISPVALNAIIAFPITLGLKYISNWQS